MQVAVPLDRPGRARVKRLAKSGYEGVTEMSWGRVRTEVQPYDVLVAIDPVGNRASWTTISVAGRPSRRRSTAAR